MVTFTVLSTNEIKLLIAKQGESVKTFSKKIGVSDSYLSQIINKKRKPSAPLAKKISDNLEKDIKEIFFIDNTCKS